MLNSNHESSNDQNKAIGIFDSGLGGLTVVREIIKTLPHESVVYLGDTARVPYGVKSPDTVTKYAFQNTKFLLHQKIKFIVVACNTASAFALQKLQGSFTPPCLGVIDPGVRAALKATQSGKIGIIGTAGTISSQAYIQAIKDINSQIVVFSQACPLFVPLVEEAWTDHPVTYRIAEIYLEFFKKKQIDTLILGCTHYPLLKKVISDILGPKVALIDSATFLARELQMILQNKGLLNQQKTTGELRFFVTDMPEHFYSLGKLFLKRAIFPVKHIDISNYNKREGKGNNED